MTRSRTERSHGRTYLQRPRLREIEVPGPGEAEPRAVVSRPHRPAKRAVLATLTASVAAEVARTGLGAAGPHSGADVASRSMTLYRSARRQLGCDSPLVLSSILTWSVQVVVAQELEAAAARAGLTSPEAMRLLERANTAAARAERAALAAADLARQLRPARRTRTALDDIEAAVADDDDEGSDGA